jgi:hypothetical protein
MADLAAPMATHGCQLPKRPLGGIGDCDNAPSITEKRTRFSGANKECPSLRVDGCLPTFERDLHGRLVKRRYFWESVRYKIVQRPEFLFCLTCWEVNQAGQERAQVIARPDLEPPTSFNHRDDSLLSSLTE